MSWQNKEAFRDPEKGSERYTFQSSADPEFFAVVKLFDPTQEGGTVKFFLGTYERTKAQWNTSEPIDAPDWRKAGSVLDTYLNRIAEAGAPTGQKEANGGTTAPEKAPNAAVVYAPSGAGKTTYIKNLPASDRQLVVPGAPATARKIRAGMVPGPSGPVEVVDGDDVVGAMVGWEKGEWWLDDAKRRIQNDKIAAALPLFLASNPATIVLTERHALAPDAIHAPAVAAVPSPETVTEQRAQRAATQPGKGKAPFTADDDAKWRSFAKDAKAEVFDDIDTAVRRAAEFIR